MRLNKEKIEKLMVNKGIYRKQDLAKVLGVSRAQLSTKLNADYISPDSRIVKGLMEFFELKNVEDITD